MKSGSGMRGQLAVLGTMSRAPSTPTPRAFGGPERYADGHKSGRALDVSFRAALRLSLFPDVAVSCCPRWISFRYAAICCCRCYMYLFLCLSF